ASLPAPRGGERGCDRPKASRSWSQLLRFQGSSCLFGLESVVGPPRLTFGQARPLSPFPSSTYLPLPCRGSVPRRARVRTRACDCGSGASGPASLGGAAEPTLFSIAQTACRL